MPPDHDDDDGRPARRGADRGWIRRRWRGAPTAGDGRRGRTDLLATRDALSDAGVLHLHGAVAEPAKARRGGARAGTVRSPVTPRGCRSGKIAVNRGRL